MAIPPDNMSEPINEAFLKSYKEDPKAYVVTFHKDGYIVARKRKFHEPWQTPEMLREIIDKVPKPMSDFRLGKVTAYEKFCQHLRGSTVIIGDVAQKAFVRPNLQPMPVAPSSDMTAAVAEKPIQPSNLQPMPVVLSSGMTEEEKVYDRLIPKDHISSKMAEQLENLPKEVLQHFQPSTKQKIFDALCNTVRHYLKDCSEDAIGHLFCILIPQVDPSKIKFDDYEAIAKSFPYFCQHVDSPGMSDIIKAILESRVPVDQKDKAGQTGFARLVEKNKLEELIGGIYSKSKEKDSCALWFVFKEGLKSEGKEYLQAIKNLVVKHPDIPVDEFFTYLNSTKGRQSLIPKDVLNLVQYVIEHGKVGDVLKADKILNELGNLPLPADQRGVIHTIQEAWQKNPLKLKQAVAAEPVRPIQALNQPVASFIDRLKAEQEKAWLYFASELPVPVDAAPTTIGKAPANADANRHIDVVPYDTNRVRKASDPSFYINASRILSEGQRYIATQGPLKTSLRQFWETVALTDSELIVSLENNPEKCEPYWDLKKGEPHYYGNMRVVLTEGPTETRIPNQQQYFEVRTFTVSSGKSYPPRKVTHLHYIGWPDHQNLLGGVPEPTVFQAFAAKADILAQQVKPNTPITVNCGAGVGRTGFFIAARTIAEKLRKNPNPDLPYPDLPFIRGTIRDLRKQRMQMVNTSDQYHFLCQLAIDQLQSPEKPAAQVQKDSGQGVARKEPQPARPQAPIPAEQIPQQIQELLDVVQGLEQRCFQEPLYDEVAEHYPLDRDFLIDAIRTRPQTLKDAVLAKLLQDKDVVGTIHEFHHAFLSRSAAEQMITKPNQAIIRYAMRSFDEVQNGKNALELSYFDAKSNKVEHIKIDPSNPENLDAFIKNFIHNPSVDFIRPDHRPPHHSANYGVYG